MQYNNNNTNNKNVTGYGKGLCIRNSDHETTMRRP